MSDPSDDMHKPVTHTSTPVSLSNKDRFAPRCDLVGAGVVPIAAIHIVVSCHRNRRRFITVTVAAADTRSTRQFALIPRSSSALSE